MTDVTDKPRYRDLVESRLRISRDFLEEYRETILDRLDSAYKVMTSEEKTAVNRDLFGINQCVHLASSIVLLASTSEALSQTVDDLKVELSESDATTVLTIATLYYLLADYVPQRFAQQRPESIGYIRKRLDAVNWMVGQPVMDVLAIKMLQ